LEATDSIYDTDTLTGNSANLNGDITINLIERISYFSFLTDCSEPTSIFWDPDMGIAGTTSAAVSIFSHMASYAVFCFALSFLF